MKLRKVKIAWAAAVAALAVAFSVQMFASAEANPAPSATSTKKFVKTNYRCSKCSCSGYWGYLHDNGTYEGACSNRDKWGHKCGHGPEKHGLKKW